MNQAITSLPNLEPTLTNYQFDLLREATNYRRAILREFAPGLTGQVLEVGAGIGQITALLLGMPRIRSVTVVEPEPAYCRQLRANFPQLTIIEGIISDVPAHKPCDAVVSVNVLEHIQDDDQELAAYHRRLTFEQGCLCLFVPARPEIYAPLDWQFGHQRRYTKKVLRSKLQQTGFEILHLRYFNLAGYFAWGVSFRLLKKNSFNPYAVRFFDRVVFPLINRIESKVLAPPLGQSLIAIARAQGSPK